MNALLLLTTLLLGADPVCTVDGDCVIVTDCACACCPPAPRSVTKAEAKRIIGRCALAGVCAPPGSDCNVFACGLPDPSLVAACRKGKCVEVKSLEEKKVAPPGGCVTDADCTMARDCGCGCCPSPTLPMTTKAALEVRQKCARLGPCGRDPKQCAGETCVPDVPGTAVCQANVCVRAPRQRPVLDAGVR